MKRLPPPLELIESAAEILGDLCERVTFVGGATLGLLASDPGSRSPRPTEDVDVTIEIASRVEFSQLETVLRGRGLQNDMSGPVCRFRKDPLVLDVMPADPAVLGFSNSWYPVAIQTAQRYRFVSGQEINLISAPCFLATKFEAFDSPTREDHGDILASRDFEDIIALIDGRSALPSETQNTVPPLKAYLNRRFVKLMSEPSWMEGVEAHLDPGRLEIVICRIQAITD